MNANRFTLYILFTGTIITKKYYSRQRHYVKKKAWQYANEGNFTVH